jgi:acyl-coenzyme A thioesterase PaaI-like protein
MKEVARYKKCFVCGEENIGGLKAKFFWDGQEAHTTVSADAAYEGYSGIYHGGIVATLLDEVMLKAILALDIYAVTAEMTVRYKKPVRTGETIKFVGRIIEEKGRLYLTEGAALDANGEPFATATGRYLKAKPDLKSQLLKSIE